MNIPTAVQQVAQEWLTAHPVDLALLRQVHDSREREDAYKMLLCHVRQTVLRGLPDEERLRLQVEVAKAVNSVCGELRL